MNKRGEVTYKDQFTIFDPYMLVTGTEIEQQTNLTSINEMCVVNYVTELLFDLMEK